MSSQGETLTGKGVPIVDRGSADSVQRTESRDSSFALVSGDCGSLLPEICGVG